MNLLYHFERRLKHKCFGYVTRHNGLEKTIMQGMVASRETKWRKAKTKMGGRHHRYIQYDGNRKSSGRGEATIWQRHLGSDILKRILYINHFSTTGRCSGTAHYDISIRQDATAALVTSSFKIFLTQTFPRCGATCYILHSRTMSQLFNGVNFVYRSMEVY